MTIVFFGLLHTFYTSATHPAFTFAKRREVFFSQSCILFFTFCMQPTSSASHFLSPTLFHLRDYFLWCFELHLGNQLWVKQKVNDKKSTSFPYMCHTMFWT